MNPSAIRIVKQGVRIMAAIVLSVLVLGTFLLALQAASTSQAASLRPTAKGTGMSNDIFTETGAFLGAIIPLEQLDAFECMVGKKHQVIKLYQHFHNGDFYQDLADSIHKRGAIVFLSFDPTVETGDLDACEVLSADYDSVVRTFARHIKSWGHPLILSFAGEMNGTWAGWSGAYNFGPDCVTYTQVSDLYGSYGCTDINRIDCADGPERYRDMYRHIHDIFATEGVTNVTWAWVVNHESIPDEGWNRFDNYYPGNDYVDVIAVDGYNWGDDGRGGCPVDPGWKTFDQIFGEALTSLSSTHYPTRPLIIGEFASIEGTDPMSKANWITNAYTRIRLDWPQIKAAIWFNLPGDCSFPLEWSQESVRAYKEAIADPHFVGDPVWCSYLPIIQKSYTSVPPPTPLAPLCTADGRGGTEIVPVEPPRSITGIKIDLRNRALQQYGFSLWEVEIYGPDANNLATGAEATASSSQDSYGCYNCFPNKAIDGNMNTRWASDFHEPQWLEIDLPARHLVSRIVLNWEKAFAQEYCVSLIE